ncbi:MAG: hypothetical protein WCJ66_11755 [Verrucomicrobiota bacterium]
MADQFESPIPGRKRLPDDLRMIAKRAESAVCHLLRSPTIDNTTHPALVAGLIRHERGHPLAD